MKVFKYGVEVFNYGYLDDGHWFWIGDCLKAIFSRYVYSFSIQFDINKPYIKDIYYDLNNKYIGLGVLLIIVSYIKKP